MKKKLLSLALALFMVLAFLPASVMAEGKTVTDETEFVNALSSAQDGDTIIINSDLAITDTVITKRVNLKGGNEGVTITGNITYQFSSDQENNKLSIEGITFKNPGANAIGLKFSGDRPNGGYNLNIDVKNCIFSGYSYALAVNSHANKYTLNVSDCDFSSSKYAVNFNRDTETSGQIADNTLVFGSNNVINPDGYAVETFGNTVGTLVKSAKTIEDFNNGVYSAVIDTESKLLAALNDAEVKEIILANDIELSKMLTIEKEVNIDLGGHTITASEDFASTYPNDSHLINVQSGTSNVTISNGKLVATDKNKHTVNVYDGADLTLKDVTVDHSRSLNGAPVVINGSDVTLEGKVELIQGENSWYGINVDPKNQTSATLTIADSAQIINKGEKPLVQIDGISSNNQPVNGKSVHITIKDGAKIDTDTPVILNKDSNGTFVPVNKEFVNIGNNTNLEFDENGNVVFVEPKPETPSTPSISCAGEKDKNCDGVITCDEEKGEGWTLNNAKGVCEYTGTTGYTVVNTAVK